MAPPTAPAHSTVGNGPAACRLADHDRTSGSAPAPNPGKRHLDAYAARQPSRRPGRGLYHPPPASTEFDAARIASWPALVSQPLAEPGQQTSSSVPRGQPYSLIRWRPEDPSSATEPFFYSRFATRRRWCPGPGSPRPQVSQDPARAAGRRGTATPTPSGSPSWPPTPPRTQTPSWASASAGWLPVPAAAGGRRPAAPWAAPSWSSSHLLNDPAARYRDLGPDWHARHTDRSRKARNARRQLEALGYDVIITLREDAA
jgi:hypothetical protein